MKVVCTTMRACTPQQAWHAVRQPALLDEVAAPLLSFAPLDPAAFPDSWEERRSLVRLFVNLFYRYRQRRWRGLVGLRFAALA